MLKRGLRPRIPNACPDYLNYCIQHCWRDQSKLRPRFSDIWRMLRFAKLRSLGLIHKNSDLFSFTNDEDEEVSL